MRAPATRPRVDGLRRLFVATLLALSATLAAMAVGGIPLVAGIALAGGVGALVLPSDARRYLARRTLVGLTTIFVAMGVVWMLVHHLPANPPINFEGDRSFPSANRSFIEMLRDDPTDVGVDLDPVGALREYADWLGDLASWDLGDTQYSETVTEGVARTIPISMQLTRDHAELAPAKGVPPLRLISHHALRPAAPTVVAAIVGALFVVICIMVVVNLIADAALVTVDPRLSPSTGNDIASRS